MRKTISELGADERQLILNCARPKLDDRLIQWNEEILQRPLDWSALVLHAELHSVAPLLFNILKPCLESHGVPAAARRRLLQLYHRAGYQNKIYSRELHHLLGAFAESEIAAIVPKGISLVELIYGSLSLRQLIDLELLVPEDQFELSQKVLSSCGYKKWRRHPVSGRLFSQVQMRKQEQFETKVLIQKHPVNWPRIHGIDLERFWGEAQPGRLSGRDALVPSPVDWLLFLCLQPNRRELVNLPPDGQEPEDFIFSDLTENRIVRFTDIYLVIKHYEKELDWDYFIQRAREAGLETSIHASFYWVTRLLDPTVEPRVLEALLPPSPRRIRKWVYETVSKPATIKTTQKKLRSFFRTWWLNQHLIVKRRLIRLIGLFEFTFPRSHEVRLHYGIPDEHTATGHHFIHCVKTFFGGCIPWFFQRYVRRCAGKLRSYIIPHPVTGRS